jgi:hypothetical protein
MNLKNFTKYITFSAFVFAILRYIPKYKLSLLDTLILTGLISSTFVIVDTVTPCIIVDKNKCIRKSVNKSKHNHSKTKTKPKPKK